MTTADRPRGGWSLPVGLGAAGVVLLGAGTALMRDAVAKFDAALAQDCLSSGCAHVGSLAQQPEYLDGAVAIAAGVVVLAIALFFAAGRAGWIGSRRSTKPDGPPK
ncbi:MAG: hypothetical protein L3K18_06530 [Thermoplasmata archaeon]|nr:hypothetical protein [Thermoplasmata archaeon]MCI4356779.1 hypothetical protein [Thermoplasmata archaeon]